MRATRGRIRRGRRGRARRPRRAGRDRPGDRGAHLPRGWPRCGSTRPAYITAELGERPSDPARRATWDSAARGIETWRMEHGIRDRTRHSARTPGGRRPASRRAGGAGDPARPPGTRARAGAGEGAGDRDGAGAVRADRRFEGVLQAATAPLTLLLPPARFWRRQQCLQAPAAPGLLTALACGSGSGLAVRRDLAAVEAGGEDSQMTRHGEVASRPDPALPVLFTSQHIRGVAVASAAPKNGQPPPPTATGHH